jgi:hypothetical protein
VPLKKTTTRALAASVAFVAAGGTVAGAAVFHLPVLGFGPTNAGATASAVASTTMKKTKTVTPIRVVKTRIVDEIVHRRAATRGTAGAAPATGVPIAPSAAGVAMPTSPPATETPDAPEAGGGEDHESDDTHEDDAHADDDSDHEEHEGHEDHGDSDETDAGTTVESGDGIHAEQ